MSDRAIYTERPPACPGCRQRDRRIADLEGEVTRLNDRLDRQERQIAQLSASLEEMRRAAKRQAAPFSRGQPKEHPKTPGRKPGPGYGQHVRRAVPQHVDEIYSVPLPQRCPYCGGERFGEVKIHQQYQAEIPRTPCFRQFDVAVGRCCGCGRHVQGRHPLQTSNALGAAASQIGPDAQAAVVMLNKELGLSHGKISRFFDVFFGIELSRGGGCHIMLRTARRLEGTYNVIVRRVQQSPSTIMIASDETGWRIGGHLAWLHVAAGEFAVAYLIDPERGIEAIVKLLGTSFAGTLVHDGFASYSQFRLATHQACLGHLIRRCGELLEMASGAAAKFPHKVKGLLQQSLRVRDRRDAGQLTAAQAAHQADLLQRRMGLLIGPRKTNPDNRRLAKHLHKQSAGLFTFLRQPGVDATNHKAEQAIRPAVVNRKVWGGNRTNAGAEAQSILMSVLATCRRRQRQAMDYISSTLRRAKVLPLLPSPSPAG